MRSLMGARTLGVVLFFAARATMGQTRPYPECTAEPTESDIAAAKGAFQAGQASFNEADYERAITYWEDAYRRDCTAHALLLNLARAYERSEEHTSELQSQSNLVCRLLLEKKKIQLKGGAGDGFLLCIMLDERGE